MTLALNHLMRMTDARGLWQHARHAVPDRRHGFCLDDNARALWLVARLVRLAPEDGRLVDLATIYAGFVDHAWDAPSGRFANFMAHDGRWLPDESEGGEDEDAGARALLALAEAAASPLPDGLTGWAVDRAAEVLASGAALRHRSPRAWAWTLAACRAARDLPLDAEAVGGALALRLGERWRASARPDRPWFEDALAYDAGRLAQAALDASELAVRAGQAALGAELRAAGLEALAWLGSVQTAPGGHLRTPGSHGYGRPGPPAPFAQQPLDAWGMVEAALAAWRLTGEARWRAEAERARAWFLGANDAGTPLAEPATGACRDGIDPQGVSANRGAESTPGLAPRRRRAAPRRSGIGPGRGHLRVVADVGPVGSGEVGAELRSRRGGGIS